MKAGAGSGLRRGARYFLVLSLATTATLISLSSAHAERRIALVIGNQQYEHVSPLQKSAADADAFAALFKDKGFDKVIVKHDLTRNGMDEAVAEFVDAVEPGDTAVFVYSGHGWSDGGNNYLAPTDTPNTGSEDFLRRVTLPIENGANGVLDEIAQKGARLKVAIIDACRDNPFVASDHTRSVGSSRGLGRMEEPPTGTFVVFSAGVGQTALDELSGADRDPNGVFTRTFVPLLRADLTLLDATKEAQEKVYEVAHSVNHDQQPAYYDETRGNTVCLSPKCGTAVPSASPDEAAWQHIASSTDPADFRNFWRFFPASPHVGEARAKVSSLSQEFVDPPPPRPSLYQVNVDAPGGYLNLRSGPGTGHQVIASIPAGAQGVVLRECAMPDGAGEAKTQWCKANWNGLDGWISTCCISRASADPASDQISRAYQINADIADGELNMRDGPGTTHNVLVSIPAGTKNIAVRECVMPDDSQSGNAPWCHATWKGHQGWLSSCCMSPIEPK